MQHSHYSSNTGNLIKSIVFSAAVILFGLMPVTSWADKTCTGLPEATETKAFGMDYVGTKDYEEDFLGSAVQYQNADKSKRLTLYRYKSEQEDLENILNEALQPIFYLQKKTKAHGLAYPDGVPVSLEDSLIKKFAVIDKAESDENYEFIGVGFHKNCTVKIRYTTAQTEDPMTLYKEFLVIAAIFPLMYLEREQLDKLLENHK